jgi:hypothetical protein
MNSSPSATCAISGSKLPSRLIGTIDPGLLRPYTALQGAMMSAEHHNLLLRGLRPGPELMAAMYLRHRVLWNGPWNALVEPDL